MHKKRLQRLTAVVLAVIMMLSLAAVAGAENTEDIVREADVSVPDEGNVLVALRGSAAVKSEKQALLNTLNALRKEACDKGYPNPENPSVALTSEDYVPLEWNADLEEMAQLRSAEGIVEESVTRPSGKNSGTITINGTNTSREDIGWAWVDNAEGADLTGLPALFYGYNGTSAAANSEIARWISASDIRSLSSMVMDCALPVSRSFAETVRIPFTSMSKDTSIWGTPAGAALIPLSRNRPMDLLSLAMGRSPWSTLISTLL